MKESAILNTLQANTLANILLVDDDIELCELLCEYIQSEGFLINSVHDGEAALKEGVSNRYDVIILDVMLPKRSGFEVLRELRVHTQVPVIMLTAKGEDIDRIIGLEMGADDYLPKPCNPRELVARLRAILRRVSANGNGHDTEQKMEPLQVGHVTLNPGTRNITRDGKTISLTSTEYNVLAVLLREAGQVVTKEAVCERALGRKLTRYDRSVDMHVSNLRKKLGTAEDGSPPIRTVRGIGYLYVVEEHRPMHA